MVLQFDWICIFSGLLSSQHTYTSLGSFASFQSLVELSFFLGFYFSLLLRSIVWSGKHEHLCFPGSWVFFFLFCRVYPFPLQNLLCICFGVICQFLFSFILPISLSVLAVCGSPMQLCGCLLVKPRTCIRRATLSRSACVYELSLFFLPGHIGELFRNLLPTW